MTDLLDEYGDATKPRLALSTLGQQAPTVALPRMALELGERTHFAPLRNVPQALL